jgi:hypothetical protein
LAACVAKQPSLFHLLSTVLTGPHTWFLDKTERNDEALWRGREGSPRGSESGRLEQGGLCTTKKSLPLRD